MFWGLNFRDGDCSDTQACGGEQSLFLISISASHYPPLLFCLQRNESQKNFRQEHFLLKNSLLSFHSASSPSALLHQCLWFSVRKCRASVSNYIKVWKFIKFNCIFKGSKNLCVFRWITKERSLSGTVICDLALDWTLKGEESFVFKQIYFYYHAVFHLGHMYDAECIHRHYEVTAIIICS